MKHWIRHIIISLVALLWCGSASAQYYSWGADPQNLKWRKIKGDNISVIFPDTAAYAGYQMMHYVKAVQPSIDFGFRYGAMDIPFIIHPENMRSNGLVMWLPKRVEILSSPSLESYSMPWLKQLAAHEYRHAVQYNNLNKSWVKAFSYILGQQSSTIGLLFMPLWGIEGDAVLSETAMSTFGRALQPSFTLHYRAYADQILGRTNRKGELVPRKNIDRWFCGSYRDYIPDHYHIGYQITSYANTKYDQNIWDKLVDYSVRHPYTIATTFIGMRKFFNTSTTKLAREAFTDLTSHWASLPQTADSATPITVPKQKCYTKYSHPIFFGAQSVIAVKESLDKPASIVRTNIKTGEQSRICHIGRLSTRPTIQGSTIWWTEYRRSLLFEQRVNSRLCYADLSTGKSRTINRYRNVIYPTATESADSIAWAEYYADGSYAIAFGNRESRRIISRLPLGTELHSLAYDNGTNRLYFIATDDSGMWIGRINEDGSLSHITEGAYITISDLRAEGGVLYFGSIASGKDEVHCLDLATGTEYQISDSKYGSFSPAPTFAGGVVMTTYDRNGYKLAMQQIDSTALKRITPARTPRNILNPKRKQWDVINLDTVRFAGADSLKTITSHKPRSYSKLGHMFNVHSWAPASYDPFELTEGAMNFNLGATIMSQSLLSDTEGTATWGWNRQDGHYFKGTLRYYGLGVNLSISGTYGGQQQMYTAYTYALNPETGKYEMVFPDAPEQKRYYNIGASAYLPLYLQNGYHTRIMGINVAWNYSNGLVAKLDKLTIEGGQITNLAKIGYTEGLHLLQAGIGFQDQIQLAPKDFLPRFGYVLSANYAFNPANSDFGQLLSLYGKVYIPGILPHHSLNIAALYQNSIGGFESKVLASNFTFHSARLLPRGFQIAEVENRDYFATSINYQFPVWYPEGGIPAILYFKRIRVNIGFDYASFGKQFFVAYPEINKVNLVSKRNELYSYGGDISIDFNLFRMPSAATTSITFSLYKPKGKPLFFSAGFGLPF
ncbi:MAG: hypothetical protein IJX65_03790 [Alistipes sp.]|nr:hypothetical protein [Alistipes sp.]